MDWGDRRPIGCRLAARLIRSSPAKSVSPDSVGLPASPGTVSSRQLCKPRTASSDEFSVIPVASNRDLGATGHRQRPVFSEISCSRVLWKRALDRKQS